MTASEKIENMIKNGVKFDTKVIYSTETKREVRETPDRITGFGDAEYNGFGI